MRAASGHGGARWLGRPPGPGRSSSGEGGSSRERRLLRRSVSRTSRRVLFGCDLLPHPLHAELPLGDIEIVLSAKHPKILRAVPATPCIGLAVVDMECRLRLTASTAPALILTAVGGTLEHLIPERGGDVAGAPLRRGPGGLSALLRMHLHRRSLRLRLFMRPL
jgi:hypothetical protein